SPPRCDHIATALPSPAIATSGLPLAGAVVASKSTVAGAQPPFGVKRRTMTSTSFDPLYWFQMAIASPLGPTARSRFHANDDSVGAGDKRSEEHTSELQSRGHLVC